MRKINLRKNHSRSAQGFTLLEILIVLVIMGTLTVLSSQALQQAIKNKVKLQTQIDDMSGVRDSLRVMERDLNLAFHYSDLELELKELIKKKKQELCKAPTTTTTLPGGGTGGSAGGTPSPSGDPPSTKPGCRPEDLAPSSTAAKPAHRADPVTHFVGKENEIYFATLNSSRLNEGISQADFLKVGYLVQSCKIPGAKSTSEKSCLVRRSSAIVEGDIAEGGDTVILLEDVTEFKLRYYGKGKQDWTSTWNSIKGDGIEKNRYPDAVEISLKIEKGEEGNRKKISMQIVVPIRFTNNTFQDNLSKTSSQAPGAPGGNSSTSGAPGVGP